MSSVQRSRAFSIDSPRRRSSIRLCIATFAEQSFVDSLICFGIVSPLRRSSFSPARTAVEILVARKLVFDNVR